MAAQAINRAELIWKIKHAHKLTLHDGDPYHIEISPLCKVCAPAIQHFA